MSAPEAPEAGSLDNDDRPSLLMLLHWARKGGAERLVVQMLEALQSDFRMAVGFVRRLAPGERTLDVPGSVVGPIAALFRAWDIIHSHLFLPGVLARLRRIWDRDFLWVHTVHYHDYGSFRFGRLKRWIDFRIIYPAVDRLVAVSPAVRNVLSDRFPDAELILNAIPLDPSPRKVPSADRGQDGPVVGTVAMLRPEKGLDDLVRAVACLREDRPNLRLRIAGEGSERVPLEALVEELDLKDRVDLLGFIEDLDSVYRSLDVYVQPSRSETFGLAALEAFRYGLPVVVSDAGYLPEMTGHGDWGVIAVRGEDFPATLAEKVDLVLRDPGRYRNAAEEGLAHWQPRLDPEEMERDYRRLYGTGGELR